MVNGQRLCSSRTLHSLQKKGLVEQADRNGKPASQWRATQAGRDLTAQLGL
jgi:DNA-binding HxlR family transcriptional regulator